MLCLLCVFRLLRLLCLILVPGLNRDFSAFVACSTSDVLRINCTSVRMEAAYRHHLPFVFSLLSIALIDHTGSQRWQCMTSTSFQAAVTACCEPGCPSLQTLPSRLVLSICDMRLTRHVARRRTMLMLSLSVCRATGRRSPRARRAATLDTLTSKWADSQLCIRFQAVQ